MKISEDCIFCKMAHGTIPIPKVYEDKSFFCIRDIRPQAKVHLLIIPKEHVVSLETAFPNDSVGNISLLGSLFEAATRVARQEGLLPGGFRSIINTGKNGGQTVFHLHAHLLGGEVLKDHFG